MGSDRRRMIVGLGNPGEAYRQTRHNAGFQTVDALAREHAIAMGHRKFNVQFGMGTIAGVSTLLVKPLAFMNRSGPPVRQIADYHRIGIGDLLVIHDDIDIEFGRIKIKEKGGTGGHKGIMSMVDAFGGGAFVRLRIGIGRPGTPQEVADYVLERFSREESALWQTIIAGACEAAVTLLCRGLEESMNRFNGKKLLVSC